MSFARRTIQASSCIAGLVVGLVMLSSCVFPTKCGESAAITDHSLRNKGASPKPTR